MYMERLAIILVAALCFVSCGIDSSNTKQNSDSTAVADIVQQSEAGKCRCCISMASSVA